MGIFRLLLLAGLAWVVYRLLQNWRVEITPRHPPSPQTPEPFERMAQCSGCGLYLPTRSLSNGERCGACEKGRA